jgi:IS30 family transposase
MGKRTITDEQRRVVRALSDQGMSRKEIERQTGMSHAAIQRELQAGSRPSSVAIKYHPTTAEVIYTPEQIEFGRAMEKFQRFRGRPATWHEVLRVAKTLGYEKVEIAASMRENE